MTRRKKVFGEQLLSIFPLHTLLRVHAELYYYFVR